MGALQEEAKQRRSVFNATSKVFWDRKRAAKDPAAPAVGIEFFPPDEQKKVSTPKNFVRADMEKRAKAQRLEGLEHTKAMDDLEDAAPEPKPKRTKSSTETLARRRKERAKATTKDGATLAVDIEPLHPDERKKASYLKKRAESNLRSRAEALRLKDQERLLGTCIDIGWNGTGERL